MNEGTSGHSESELGLGSREDLEYHGRVFIKPVGRGIKLLDIEGNSQIDPYLAAFGEPLRLEDLMREGLYRMDLVLTRIGPDEQSERITPDAD
ncbi:hypothetical protein B2J88_35795 [Rhodococcus sp. SRB_17]|nr:hypothetical protein [Rhodococcus sp. SRB_17]